MQRSISWWESLTDQQRADIVSLPHGLMPDWVLDTMEAADVPLARATVGGNVVRLPPTITTDFIALRRSAGG